MRYWPGTGEKRKLWTMIMLFRMKIKRFRMILRLLEIREIQARVTKVRKKERKRRTDIVSIVNKIIYNNIK